MDIDGELKSAQAYQVIGELAGVAGLFEHPEVVRALDYFGDAKKVDQDFPRFVIEGK